MGFFVTAKTLLQLLTLYHIMSTASDTLRQYETHPYDTSRLSLPPLLAQSTFPALQASPENRMSLRVAQLDVLIDDSFVDAFQAVEVLDRITLILEDFCGFAWEKDPELARMVLIKVDKILRNVAAKSLRAAVPHASVYVSREIIHGVLRLVKIVYTWTNPLKTGVWPEKKTQLFICEPTSFELLTAARNLRCAIEEAAPLLDGLRGRAAKVVLRNFLRDNLQTVGEIGQTVIRNSVPTSLLFAFFTDNLHTQSFTLLDVELLEEFLGHFQDISDMQTDLASTPKLLEHQKALIKEKYSCLLQLFPAGGPSWCTRSDSINNLQHFIDIYNHIYKDDLLIEVDPDVYQNTVLKHSVELEKAPLDAGDYRYHVQMYDEGQTDLGPVFGIEDSASQSGRRLKLNKAAMSRLKLNKAAMNRLRRSFQNHDDSPNSHRKKGPAANPHQSKSGLSEPISAVASATSGQQELAILNEKVRMDLSDGLVSKPSRISEFLGPKVRSPFWFKDANCRKCRYIPWHRHTPPDEDD